MQVHFKDCDDDGDDDDDDDDGDDDGDGDDDDVKELPEVGQEGRAIRW